MTIQAARAKKFARELVQKYEIDCRGLVILTEAASGAYIYNPMIPILGGAERVITFCRHSQYAGVNEVEKMMHLTYKEAGLNNCYEFKTLLSETEISSADIVTNSGHLRPFDGKSLEGMKDTAVIPLMWEPWELREDEIDLEVARRKGILVMGTNEHQPPCDMRPYSFLTAMHLAMSHKTSIAYDRILVIGDQYTLAHSIEEGFRRLEIACRRICPTSSPEVAMEAAIWATYIIVAEHADHRLLIGPGGLIDTKDLIKSKINGVGVISGVVDREHLEAHGISVFPAKIAEPGFMTYLPSELGPYPVMDLFAAGIKVGQVMANCRLAGFSVQDAAQIAIEKGPAMDLEGIWSWIKQ